jgi:hypothetical protein
MVTVWGGGGAPLEYAVKLSMGGVAVRVWPVATMGMSAARVARTNPRGIVESHL